MTKIILDTDSIEITGHAKDPVVCHAISAISQMVANYVEDLEWGKVERSEGYLKIHDIKVQYCGTPLFCAFGQAIRDIEKEYPENIKIIYKK